jgi:hypothetical protein
MTNEEISARLAELRELYCRLRDVDARASIRAGIVALESLVAAREAAEPAPMTSPVPRSVPPSPSPVAPDPRKVQAPAYEPEHLWRPAGRLAAADVLGLRHQGRRHV